MEELNSILSMIPGADTLPNHAKSAALGKSLIPDREGNLPGDKGYTAAYDAYYAAYLLAVLVRSAPKVTAASSEGTSITVSDTDWNALYGYLHSMSIILSQSSTFHVIPVPDDLHISRNDMSGKDGYGDINTDLG